MSYFQEQIKALLQQRIDPDKFWADFPRRCAEADAFVGRIIAAAIVGRLMRDGHDPGDEDRVR